MSEVSSAQGDGYDAAASREALARGDRRALARLGALELGVATSAFQCEGGLDGPGEPETNWRAWVARGRAERIGPGCGLWRRYGEAASRARALGLRCLRVGLEWARLCPDGPAVEPRAARAYAERLARVRRAGLEPWVTLQHFTHPAWAGPDLWLDAHAPELFARYARDAAAAIDAALEALGEAPLARFVTVNEPNMLALASYAAGVFPHRAGAAAEGAPLGVLRSLRALDALLAGHALAHRALHALHAERGYAAPVVCFNANFIDVYTLGVGLLDLVRAPSAGVSRAGLAAHLAERRAHFYAALCEDERSPRVQVARALEVLLARLVGPSAFPATLEALYPRRGAARGALDARAIDVYDPWSFQQLRGAQALWTAWGAGAARVALGGRAEPALDARLAEPWEWVSEPAVLRRALRATHDPRDPLPLDVLENGMAQRRREGEPRGEREDGVSRGAFLRGHLRELFCAAAVDALPVRSYCHWTLVDNYELGRWSPRFGLFALPDPPRGPGKRAARWASRDAAGDDAAAALARGAALVRRAREAAGSSDAELASLRASLARW